MKNSKELHREFVTLVFDIIKMKNKLMSLFLEIYEREIYNEQGCRTIYEYGFKYARFSKEVIDKALRTLKHLQDKPCLKQAIETQGIHKVAMVATIATPETDKMLAGHVTNMSKATLFEFAKELRHGHEKCEAVRGKMKIELDEEMLEVFLRLKEKYAKGCSNGEALKVMLGKLVGYEVTDGSSENSVPGNGISQKISSTKTTDKSRKFAQPMDAAPTGLRPEQATLPELQPPKIPSRHILVATNQKILNKYQHKCAYPNCPNPPQQLHHRVPFAFNKSHDSVIPLCKIHHEFAHNGVIGYELSEPENWRLALAGRKTVFDQFYLGYRW